MPLRTLTFEQLTIDDERPLERVETYRRLREVLRHARHVFRVPAEGTLAGWDRVVFLNLTYWSGEEAADVLADEHIAADVVAHIAWHHAAAREIARAAPGPLGAEAMLFGEAIASAFDLYLVGRLLPHVPESDFIATQVPIMAEAAEGAGLAEADFTTLMEAVSEAPERAFEDLRELLFDASRALLACRDAAGAQAALERFAGHRFEPLLHHFQLSNWILYARAYAASAPAQDAFVRGLDAELRAAPDALALLTARWLPEV